MGHVGSGVRRPDIVSQLIDSKQWARAYGIAYNAESEPQGRSFPYAAYKQIRPTDEPAFGVEELYYQLYMLSIGLEMAGPDLTPQSFEAGMFAYPASSGPRGLWHFGPGDYTSTDDFREIWWDPSRVSGQNNRPGAWVQLNGGQRYTRTSPPPGPTHRLVQGGLMSSSNGNGNGTSGHHDALPRPRRSRRPDAIAALRTKPDNVLLFRGFGPLVAALVLFVLMLVLAPSVAPSASSRSRSTVDADDCDDRRRRCRIEPPRSTASAPIERCKPCSARCWPTSWCIRCRAHRCPSASLSASCCKA